MANYRTDELIDRYGQKVYNLAFRVTGSRQDAEDMTQETFMQVHENIGKFREESDISTWIYRIALNNCLKLKKKMDRAYVESLDEKIEIFRDDIPGEVAAWYEDPEKAAYLNELLQEIRNGCLHFLSFRLPQNQRIVYILRNILDFSYREISAILGVSENVVKARLNRARANLVEFFSPRCQWLNENPECSCRSRIGFALAYDPEILKRVRAQAEEIRPGDVQMQKVIHANIDELFQKVPQVEYTDLNKLKTP